MLTRLTTRLCVVPKLLGVFAELCKSLGKGASPAVPILIKQLETGFDDHARATVAQALGAIGPDASVAIGAIQRFGVTHPHAKEICEQSLQKSNGSI